AECGKLNVARAPELPHHVRAGVEPEVFHARAERAEVRQPRPLAASDVEDRAEAPLQEVLRRRDRKRDLPPHLGRSVHLLIAIPLVEVRAVVAFHCSVAGGHRPLRLIPAAGAPRAPSTPPEWSGTR